MTTPRSHTAQDPDFEFRVRQSFDKQRFMATIGASIVRVEPGEVDLELSARDDLVQQHGFLHAGVLASAADSACGYAALSLMPAGAAVLSVEFKINMLAPAAGERFVARGRVIRAGKTVTVCWGDVTAYSAGREKLVATMVGTMMTVQGRGLSD
ncbi:MAG: PaaI family thioesterase [Gemmatimonadaceae bacterium]